MINMIIKTYDLIGLDKCYACDIKFKALKEAHLNALSKLDSLGITLYSDGGDDFVYLYKDKLSFGYDITIDGETFDVSIEYKVLNTRIKGHKGHKCKGKIGEHGKPPEHRFKKSGNNEHHLGNGLELSEHRRRHDDSALTCYHEAQAGNAELSKEYQKHDPNEHERKGGLPVEDHPYEDSYHRSNNHKLICQRVDKLSKIGNEVILSRYFAIQHIGKTGDNIDDGRNYYSPYLYISHKE